MPWHMPPCRTKTPLHPYRQRGRQHQRVCFRINQFLVVSDASNRQVSWLTALIHPHLPVLTVAGLTPGCMLPITVTRSHRLLSVSLFSRALPLTPVAYTLCMIMPKWLFFKLLSRKSPKSRKTLRAFLRLFSYEMQTENYEIDYTLAPVASTIYPSGVVVSVRSAPCGAAEVLCILK